MRRIATAVGFLRTLMKTEIVFYDLIICCAISINNNVLSILGLDRKTLYSSITNRAAVHLISNHRLAMFIPGDDYD